MEISENSENHLEAIVGGPQMAGVVRLSDRGGKGVGKTQGEGKAVKSGERGWHSGVASANYMDLRGRVLFPLGCSYVMRRSQACGGTRKYTHHRAHPSKIAKGGAASVVAAQRWASPQNGKGAGGSSREPPQ